MTIKHQDFNIETIMDKIMDRLSKFKIKALAEDKTNLGGSTSDGSDTGKTDDKKEPDNTPIKEVTPINFEDLISKARAEEKSKLYPQIESLKTDKTGLVDKNNQLLIDVADRDATIENLNTKVADLESEVEKVKESKMQTESETINTLKAEIEDLKQQLLQSTSNQVDVEELENRIKDEYEVKMYRLEKLNEESTRDKVIPELVTGTTKEEIDQSLEVARERYKQLIEGAMSGVRQNLTPNQPNTTSEMNSKELSAESIQGMSMSDYAEYRKTLGLK